MQERQLIEELSVAGTRVNSVFAVESVVEKTNKNGKPFLILSLLDGRTKIAAKRWDLAPGETTTALAANVLQVVGVIEPYGGLAEIKITMPLKPPAEPVDIAEFMRCAPLPLAQMLERLGEHIASVTDPHLSALLAAVFIDDQNLRERFIIAPAATGMHHAWRHGLLQHTLEVADLLWAIATAQRHWGRCVVNRDLAVTGALLHDIGKVHEITASGAAYKFTRAGSLLGHISIGYELICRKTRQMKKGVGFPDELRDALLHMILSHHGKGEWGSPVSPMIGEALALHMADQLDVQLFHLSQLIDEPGTSDEPTRMSTLEGPVKHQGRRVYVGSLGLAEKSPIQEPELDSMDEAAVADEDLIAAPAP